MSCPAPSLPVHRCAGFVVFRRNKGGGDEGDKVEFLLLQGSGRSGNWGPPKGHLEGEETEWEAAIRETREESGLEVEEDLDVVLTEEEGEGGFRAALEYRVDSSKHGLHWKRVTLFLGQIREGKADKVRLSHEHRDFRWADLETACRLVFHANSVELLRRCHERIAAEK